VTTASLIDCERRYLALFELDELLPEPTGAAVASSSAD
jgi:hypothetical protein